MQKTILLLSDSQIVTGIAILAAGFIQSHQMTIYHFEIMIYLAWHANSTHMTTLTISRNYLRCYRPVLKRRITAMTVIFIMLFVAVLLTLSPVWPPWRSGESLYMDSIVFCAWGSNYFKNPMKRPWQRDNIFATCLLTAGYIARLSKLFISSSTFFKHWFRDRPGSWLKSLFDKTEKRSSMSRTSTSRLF